VGRFRRPTLNGRAAPRTGPPGAEVGSVVLRVCGASYAPKKSKHAFFSVPSGLHLTRRPNRRFGKVVRFRRFWIARCPVPERFPPPPFAVENMISRPLETEAEPACQKPGPRETVRPRNGWLNLAG